MSDRHFESGRSTVGPPRSDSPDSPKSPRFVLGLPNLTTTRLNVPYLTRSTSNPTRSNSQRSSSQRSNVSPISPSESVETPSTPVHSRPITPDSWREQVQQPPLSAAPSYVRDNSSRRFVGIDPAEQHLAELAQVGRDRTRRHKRRRRRKERKCGPKIKSKRIRAKILLCFILGMVSNFDRSSKTDLLIHIVPHNHPHCLSCSGIVKQK